MEKKPDVELILFNKFLNNQCSDEEREIVLFWLSEPRNEELAAQMMQTHWASVNTAEGLEEIEVDNLLANTRARISQESETAIPQLSAGPFSSLLIRRNVKLLLAAAAVIIFILARVLLLNFEYPASAGLEKSISQAKEITTPAGEIFEATLPDGTKVKLNAQSSLSYAENFLRNSNREVVLKGEAFFDVTEDSAHPFIVRTKGIDVVVLGTSFNVKSYDDDATIETTLVRGKVRIENHDEPSKNIQLIPNQKAVFTRQTKTISTADIDENDLITWTDKTLRFKNEEIGNVLKTLQRWYGVTIRVDDMANTSCKLTTTFEKNSLPEALEILKSLVEIDYTMNGEEVLITGKLCD